MLWGPYDLHQNYQNQPYAAAALCFKIQRPYVLRNSLMLQRRKDLLSFPDGPTFTVLVILRIESASAFSTTNEQHNSLAKECVTRQKSKTRPGNYSGPKQGETSLRAIRVQWHAAILRTLHADISDVAQLATLIRGVNETLSVTEEFLQLVPVMDTTTANYIFNSRSAEQGRSRLVPNCQYCCR